MMLRSSGMLNDSRLALRWVSRRPGLAATAIVSLALGIGANAAVVNLIDALLFRPFPVERPEEIVALGSGRENDPMAVSKPDFDDLRRIQEPLTGLASYATFTFSVRASETTERLGGALVSSNYFAVLGVVPRRGRDFLETEDEKPTPVAIVSQGLWRSRFGADPGVLGKILRVNGHDLTIVGVAPPGFYGTSVDRKAEIWIPLSMLPELWPGMVDFFEPRGQAALAVLGRLKPGVSLQEAEAAMKAHARALEQAYPDTNSGTTATLVPLSKTRFRQREDAVSYLAVVLGTAATVFLIAVINVAGLRLIDLKDRETEIAVRRAIGASAARLGRQFLAENLLVYGAAFALSLVVAFGTIHLLEKLSLFRMALSDLDLRLDLRTLAAALALAFAGALAGSLVPLLASRSMSLSQRSGRLASGGARLRGGFLVAQVALSSALLVGAGLLARTLSKVYAIDPGFETDRVLFVSVDLQSLEFRYDETRARRFYEEVLERVESLPGVRSASWSADIPFERMTLLTFFVPEEAEVPSELKDWIQEDADIVTPGFFRTMGLDLLRGRSFTDADGLEAPGVILVNETMARTYWPGEDPIGKRIRAWSRRGVHHDLYEIVGVVRDAKYRTLWEEPRPYLYFPLAQRFFQRMNLHVRTEGPPMDLLPALREAIRSIDDDLPLYDARPIGEERAILLARQRSVGSLLGASALLAVVLAAVGTYGATAQQVARRAPELGLRMALGAERKDILRFVFRLGLGPVVFGAAIGLALAFPVGKAISSLLIGIEATDGPAFALAGVAAVLSAAAACWIPAARAARMDPMAALRGE